MNLIKMFTYGGIIEVFVVPHVLPYVVSFVPSHIMDMIQISITVISSLFPHVTVNVQSEVFLKVWNDSDKKTVVASTSGTVSDVDSKEEDPRSPSSSIGDAKCSKYFIKDKESTSEKPDMPSADDDTVTSKPSPNNDGCPKSCPSNGITSSQHDNAKQNSNTRNKCERRSIVRGASSRTCKEQRRNNSESNWGSRNDHSQDDRKEMFSCSCSTEYQVKTDHWRDADSAQVSFEETGSRPCKTCEIQRLMDESQKHPDFSKSCSLEFVTKLKEEEQKTAKNKTVSDANICDTSCDSAHCNSALDVPEMKKRIIFDLDWKRSEVNPEEVSEKLSIGSNGKHRIAVLLHRANQHSPVHRSAPGSPSPSVASYGSTSSSSDLIATASSAIRRLHFKSSNVHRSTKTSVPIEPVVPKPTVINSHSISTDSCATMNTSTDSANTATTMVTLTDNGEADGIELIDEKIRITANLLENTWNQTPSSTDKEEDFLSASSNDETNTRKSSEELNIIFPTEEIVLEEYDDSIQPLLQHTTIPKPNQSFSMLEDSKLPVIADNDPSVEWYNIKMRQQKLDATQKRAMQTRRRLKLLSKKYSKCYFEEERTRNDKGRNSSGFAAEQMTIDSEDSFQWESVSVASPPVPTSPTGSLTPIDSEQTLLPCPSPSKTKQHFTFPPMTDANDLVNEYKVKVDKHRRQSQASVTNSVNAREAVSSSAGGELFAKKQRIESTSVSVTSHRHGEEWTINKATRNVNESDGGGGSGGGVATIVVQQPSVTGNSPEQSCDKCDIGIVSNNVRRKGSSVFADVVNVGRNAVSCSSTSPKQKETIMKQMLDVTNTTPLHQWQDLDSKYSSHHNRSQSVRTPGSKSNVQVSINGTSRYRPNYLCLPQQRTRVASMPNTGVEEEYYRLRQFSISGKNIINRGDSLKSRRSRSNTSVASSNSSHSTEQITVCGTTGAVLSGGACSSQGGTVSAVTSLPSSRESSCASCPGITPPYRVVMLGSSGVGKSSIVSQFMTSEYLQASGISIDEDFGEKSVCVSLDGEESEIIFIDQPASKISPMNISAFESPQGFCVVYSTSDRESFQQAEMWLQALWRTDSIRTKAVILVGNKTDLVRIRVVSTEEGTKMATSYDCKFIETSVGINHNVDELLVGILTQIRLKLDNPPDPSIPRDQYNAKKRSRSPLSNCAPRLYRGSRTSASLRVRKILSKVWSINSKSKSCENLHVL